jgi:dUTP pyrophosphatase
LNNSELMYYLAQPIDFGEADPTLVDFAKGWIEGTGACLYDPKQAWTATIPDYRVSHINNVSIENSDAVVAFFPDTKTLGVPSEITLALACRIPVLIVADQRLIDQSFIITGWQADPLVKVVTFVRDDIEAGLCALSSTAVAEVKKFKQQARLLEGNQPLRRAPLVFEPIVDATTPYDSSAGMLPTRGYSDDAGFDLYTSESVTVPSGEFVDIPCGVRVDLPEDTWGFITGRSSSLRKLGLLVSTGVIDNGWTGPLFAGVKNLSDHDVKVTKGDRIAQMILLPTVSASYEPVWGLVSEKERGERGFGSTGS